MEDLQEIRGLLIEIFINNEPDNLITKLFDFEDSYINEAYKEQNRILNESISSNDENNEARLSHLEFYCNFNMWYLKFAEKNTILCGGSK